MIYRIEVSAKGHSSAETVVGAAREAGLEVSGARETRVFFVDSPESVEKVRAVALPVLVDSVVEEGAVVTEAGKAESGRLEIHLKPGVMDPVAASTELALRAAGLDVKAVRTGRAFVLNFGGKKSDENKLKYLGGRVLGNSVIESVHLERVLPTSFPEPRVTPFEVKSVALRDLSDEQLMVLSRNGHLFLNLVEMKAIQEYYKKAGREPTDVELETLAQTWSEHCVHKTLKAKTEVYDESGKLLRTYGNLIKETIFDSTMELMRKGMDQFCLSVFKDNAGVIALDETDAVCFKVETHNRPSAIDPYGGAATGVGGCIRDVMGTGLGAKPIANTDVFCVALPENWAAGAKGNPQDNLKGAKALPPGVLHPKRTLNQVVAGVRDYGNRMGIPTVNGAVFFDDRYVANPLVFCGCVGLLPRNRIQKKVNAGDAVVVMGGRTGRDGIHGATFSSAELTSTHADEFSHAVQIGNAITQKKMMDVLLQAADRGLYSAVTDCGAGGLSSACGEMGEKLGAEIHLDRVPLKYAGLRYDEIWISEAQERMVIAVPKEKVEELLALARGEDVEATVLGHFGTEGRMLRLYYNGKVVGEMAMALLHDGIPMPTRKAVVGGAKSAGASMGWWGSLAGGTSQVENLTALLANPNVASKAFIVRQYDHEVQGMSVVKPLVGVLQRGPSDAAVLRPKASSKKGVALGAGMAPWTEDPYEMALMAIDEAVRNVVAVGGDPERTAILDNFCWPGTDNEKAMGDLVRTAEACKDAALAYGIPFISGKDSLHNQYTNKETGEVTRIPNTLLVSAISIVEDTGKCVTMELKKAGNSLVLVEASGSSLQDRIALHKRVAKLIASGKVAAAHDVSDGGWLTAVAEMAIGSKLGAKVTETAAAFEEKVAAYVLEVPAGVDAGGRVVGQVTVDAKLVIGGESVAVEELVKAWTGTLDW